MDGLNGEGNSDEDLLEHVGLLEEIPHDSICERIDRYTRPSGIFVFFVLAFCFCFYIILRNGLYRN